MRGLLKKFNENWLCQVPMEKDFLVDFNDDSYILYVKNTCSWYCAAGGCTMCNYTSKDGVHVKDVIKRRFDNIISEIQSLGKTFRKIKFYFNGSFFAEDELDLQLGIEFIKCLVAKFKINYVSLETRPEFVTVEKLKLLKRETNISYELCFGIESINEQIRIDCLNKGNNIQYFYQLVEDIKDLCNIKAYLLIKPPFVSEKASIEDVVNSVYKLMEIGITRISFAPIDIQPNTLLEFLLQENLYRPIWLWSIIEINSRLEPILKKNRNIHLANLSHFPSPIASAFNCEKCTEHIIKRLKDNRLLTWNDFEQVEPCSCINEWRKAVLEDNDIKSIKNKIYEASDRIRAISKKSAILKQQYACEKKVKLISDPAKQVPQQKIVLDCVGINHYKIPLKISTFENTICDVELMIDLDEFHRGIHMSRLVELLNQFSTNIHEDLLLEMESFMLTIKEFTGCTNVYFNLATSLFAKGKSPVREKLDYQSTEIFLCVQYKENHFLTKCEFQVPIINACPCTLTTSQELFASGFTHTQRGKLSITFDNTKNDFLYMFRLVNRYRNVFDLLKREDEISVVKAVYDKPQFCEDICRNISANISEIKKISRGNVIVKVETDESIHTHSAIATKKISFN